MSVIRPNCHVPTVLLNGADIPLTDLNFHMGVDEIPTIELYGHMPTSLDPDEMLKQGGRLLLTLTMDNGEELRFMGSVVEEPE